MGADGAWMRSVISPRMRSRAARSSVDLGDGGVANILNDLAYFGDSFIERLGSIFLAV